MEVKFEIVGTEVGSEISRRITGWGTISMVIRETFALYFRRIYFPHRRQKHR